MQSSESLESLKSLKENFSSLWFITMDQRMISFGGMGFHVLIDMDVIFFFHHSIGTPFQEVNIKPTSYIKIK